MPSEASTAAAWRNPKWLTRVVLLALAARPVKHGQSNVALDRAPAPGLTRPVRILVTGGSGFVGRHVCEDLAGRGHEVIASIRSPAAARRLPPGVSSIDVAPLGPGTEWRPALRDVDAVVHLAGLAHVLQGASDEAL